MKSLQLLSFELTNHCNLSHIHPWCPSNRYERYADAQGIGMTDPCILDFVCACMRYGFQGRVAFHFYNEPTLNIDRCVWLANACKSMGIGNVLWTNGTCRNIPENTFDDVFVTEYDTAPDGVTRAIPYRPDSRIDIYSTDPMQGDIPPCYRPSRLEMPINYYGDIRMCCGDWKGTVRIGNIMRDKPADIFAMWARVGAWAECGAPFVCKCCHALQSSPALIDGGYRLWA